MTCPTTQYAHASKAVLVATLIPWILVPYSRHFILIFYVTQVKKNNETQRTKSKMAIWEQFITWCVAQKPNQFGHGLPANWQCDVGHIWAQVRQIAWWPANQLKTSQIPQDWWEPARLKPMKALFRFSMSLWRYWSFTKASRNPRSLF